MAANLTVPARVENTHKAIAEWIIANLIDQGARARDWDQHLYYNLPGGGVVRASTLTDTSIAMMPHCPGDVSGVHFRKDELDAAKGSTATYRARLAVMRAHRHGPLPVPR